MDPAAALTRWELVEAALSGRGPAVSPVAGELEGVAVPEGVALVVGTSGSTGAAKYALLTAAGLRASVAGVHAHLGGPGQWVLAGSPAHITGFQAVLRSYTAGFAPVPVAAGSFTGESFAAAVARMDAGAPRRYTTLVPTQLVRLLESPVGVEAARALDVILVGGAPLPPATRARAQAAGLVVTTGYGASETSGGCVYEGRPLPCAQVRLDADGRVLVGGRIVALGYAGRPDATAAAFRTDGAGVRWFRTDDLGEIASDGHLRLLGRADDIINTGGLKVAPRLVEDAILATHPDLADAVVVGIPDPHWGQAVAVVLVPRPGQHAPALAELRDALRDRLPGHALPHHARTLPCLPLTGPGKTDRHAIIRGWAAGA